MPVHNELMSVRFENWTTAGLGTATIMQGIRSSCGSVDAYYDMHGRYFECSRLGIQWAKNTPLSATNPAVTALTLVAKFVMVTVWIRSYPGSQVLFWPSRSLVVNA
ncbi:hypothetical protein JOM56_012938 [Amanita muscaria]